MQYNIFHILDGKKVRVTNLNPLLTNHYSSILKIDFQSPFNET